MLGASLSSVFSTELQLTATSVSRPNFFCLSLAETTMTSPAGTIRKRKDASFSAKAKDASTTGASKDTELDALVEANLQNKAAGVEWDYRIALAIITGLGFITRFWGISHPNQVVFDEVHFGKVRPHLIS